MDRFQDRADAGVYLAEQLQKYAGKPDTIVLGLPRGGVVVAYEVARGLGLPLDVFLVRKLGVPGYEELAMGAIASGGVQVINQDVLRSIRISESRIQEIAAKETEELKRREQVYRRKRGPLVIKGWTVILVDDGLATGATMRAAVEALGKLGPRKIVVAVPVASVEACAEFRAAVDEIVCGITPAQFHAVGAWYEDFSQTTDQEVIQLLREAQTPGETTGVM
ncbi:MAG: phosphoribosyltransferase [Deltaproteobacteria bacterium]|nr:phosphoribosyltransferase [Deltaproteobacteria bacterium]